MLRRVGVAISVGLADSLNPSTAGPAPYLATVRNRVWRVTQFTIGVFSVTLAGGLVLTNGPGRLLLGLGTRRLRAPDPRRVTLRSSSEDKRTSHPRLKTALACLVGFTICGPPPVLTTRLGCCS